MERHPDRAQVSPKLNDELQVEEYKKFCMRLIQCKKNRIQDEWNSWNELYLHIYKLTIIPFLLWTGYFWNSSFETLFSILVFMSGKKSQGAKSGE